MWFRAIWEELSNEWCFIAAVARARSVDEAQNKGNDFLITNLDDLT